MTEATEELPVPLVSGDTESDWEESLRASEALLFEMVQRALKDDESGLTWPLDSLSAEVSG